MKIVDNNYIKSDMSLLDLIQGADVEWKTVGEVAKVFAGGTPRTSNSEFYDGDIPWIRSGEVNFNIITNAKRNITLAGLQGSSAKMIRKNSVVMAMTGATVARTAVIEFETSANQSVAAIETDESIINYKYLYHFLAMNYQMLKSQGQGALTSLNLQMIKAISIPIPSLATQQKIVEILDKMTDYVTELTAELTLRQKQYAYYRDQLLNFGAEANPLSDSEESLSVRWTTLGDVFEMKAGKFISASEISSEKSFDKQIPCYGGNGLRGFVSTANEKGKHSLIGRQGALCGNVKRVDGDFYATEHAVVVTEKDSTQVNIDYAYYLLTVMNLNQYASKSAQPGLAVSTLLGLKIPLPPLKLQAKIVEILDKFQALTEDVSGLLPEEIALRQKQYAYYREQLLSFKKEN